MMLKTKVWIATVTNMMCKYKGHMDKGGHYDVRNVRVDAKRGN